jgi:hypothetical protein
MMCWTSSSRCQSLQHEFFSARPIDRYRRITTVSAVNQLAKSEGIQSKLSMPWFLLWLQHYLSYSVEGLRWAQWHRVNLHIAQMLSIPNAQQVAFWAFWATARATSGDVNDMVRRGGLQILQVCCLLDGFTVKKWISGGKGCPEVVTKDITFWHALVKVFPQPYFGTFTIAQWWASSWCSASARSSSASPQSCSLSHTWIASGKTKLADVYSLTLSLSIYLILSLVFIYHIH